MAYKKSEKGNTIAIASTEGTRALIFADAAHGLFDTVGGTSKIRGDVRQEIVIQADTISALFREWLKEILARIVQMGMLYSDVEVFSIQEAGSQMVLTGALYGEAVDPSRHTVSPVTLDEKSASCNGMTCSFNLKRD